MIYGKLSLEDWRTACMGGDKPESLFDSNDVRIFFYGTLCNRDAFSVAPQLSNAALAASLFRSDGARGFSRLDGSFTIVYYSADECGVARDHHGTHLPVYCTASGQFSSSWQYLEEQSGHRFTCDPLGLSSVLQRGILTGDGFLLKEVRRLNPGERFYYAKSDVGHSAASSFPARDSLFTYSLDPVIEASPDVDAYSQRYGELHAQSIRRRIGNSNHVGILLSGGYDSGSNLAALRSIYDGTIDSYSIGFRGNVWTELPMARLMSDTFDTRHHEYEIDGSEITALPSIIRFLGEPFVEGGLMVNYCAMRLIGDTKPEVILGGDGSDQYFGTSGRGVALHYLTGRMGLHPFLRLANSLMSHPSFDTGGKLSRIKFHADGILHLMEGDRFGFSDVAMRQLLLDARRDYAAPTSPKSDLRSFEHLYTQHAYVSDVDIVINRVILYKASRMACMFGNNLTFPYMDLDLYHFLQKLPVSLKCKGDSVWKMARGQAVAKYLLKYHYKPLLPEAITSKKKQGGFAPMPLFFQDVAQRSRLKDFILSSSIYKDYLRRDVVEKFLTDYDREASQTGGWFWHRQNKALQYFNLLALIT